MEFNVNKLEKIGNVLNAINSVLYGVIPLILGCVLAAATYVMYDVIISNAMPGEFQLVSAMLLLIAVMQYGMWIVDSFVLKQKTL